MARQADTASSTPSSDGAAARRAALVVAVSSYADPALRQLRSPAGDAQEFGEVLGSPDLGGFDVTTVVDARTHDIRVAVEEFLEACGPDDLALVYLSCHGLVDMRRRLYFAGADTVKERLASTGVEARWLLDQLEECRARRQLVILDCCFSGAFATGAKGDDTVGLGDELLGQGRGRVVLTASRATEYSFEGSPTDDAVSGSVFTAALVAGIRTGAADLDDDGFISVDDAYSYAFDEMRAAGAQQTPQRWLYGAEGDIVLARNPAATRVGPIPPRRPETHPAAAGPASTTAASATGSGRPSLTKRTRLLALAVAAVIAVAAGGLVSWSLWRGDKVDTIPADMGGVWSGDIAVYGSKYGVTLRLTAGSGSGRQVSDPASCRLIGTFSQVRGTGSRVTMAFHPDGETADCQIGAGTITLKTSDDGTLLAVFDPDGGGQAYWDANLARQGG